MNPYLAMAAMLAAGLKGIEDQLELDAPYTGDAYSDDHKNHVPRTLRDARDAFLASDFMTEAFGAETVAHYARAAEWEIQEFDRIVTDYEIARGFEKA
jgi:glutamine synthetase